MLLTRNLAFIAFAILAFSSAARDNPLLGTWSAKVPGTNKTLTMSFTEDKVLFGDERAEAYRLVPRANTFLIYIGKGSKPGIFTPMGDGKAELDLPDGTRLPLTRVVQESKIATAGEQKTPATSGAPLSATATTSADDPLTAGVQTPFVPMKANLPQLIKAGWTPIGSGVSADGYTLMLTAGRSFALCTLIPDEKGEGNSATVDCRRLN